MLIKYIKFVIAISVPKEQKERYLRNALVLISFLLPFLSVTIICKLALQHVSLYVPVTSSLVPAVLFGKYIPFGLVVTCRTPE